MSRDDLLAAGFGKMLGQFDDMESSREGAGTRDNAAHFIRKHLEDVGLDGDIGELVLKQTSMQNLISNKVFVLLQLNTTKYLVFLVDKRSRLLSPLPFGTTRKSSS